MSVAEIEMADLLAAEAKYQIFLNERGALVIEECKKPDESRVPLFSLDQIQGILQERLPQGFRMTLEAPRG